MDIKDVASGALSGGIVASVIQWVLGRSDTAQQRRETEIRRVTSEVIADERISDRLITLEAILPRVEADVKSLHEYVTSDQLPAAIARHITLNKARIPVRDSDTEK